MLSYHLSLTGCLLTRVELDLLSSTKLTPSLWCLLFSLLTLHTMTRNFLLFKLQLQWLLVSYGLLRLLLLLTLVSTYQSILLQVHWLMQLVLFLEDCSERVPLFMNLGSLQIREYVLIEWIRLRCLVRWGAGRWTRKDWLWNAWESCMHIWDRLCKGRGEAALLGNLEVLAFIYLLNL